MAEIPNNHLGYETLKTNGINSQPQRVQDFSHQQYHACLRTPIPNLLYISTISTEIGSQKWTPWVRWPGSSQRPCQSPGFGKPPVGQAEQHHKICELILEQSGYHSYFVTVKCYSILGIYKKSNTRSALISTIPASGTHKKLFGKAGSNEKHHRVILWKLKPWKIPVSTYPLPGLNTLFPTQAS